MVYFLEIQPIAVMSPLVSPSLTFFKFKTKLFVVESGLVMILRSVRDSVSR